MEATWHRTWGVIKRMTDWNGCQSQIYSAIPKMLEVKSRRQSTAC